MLLVKLWNWLLSLFGVPQRRTADTAQPPAAVEFPSTGALKDEPDERDQIFEGEVQR